MSVQRYPDILGMLTDQRLTVEMVVQCSLGVFPRTTTLGQPIEALLLLQNLTDQPLELQITTRIPTRNPDGDLINVFTPKPRLAFKLPAGEAGLLHIPLTPQLPTPTGRSCPILLKVDVKKPGHYEMVRPLGGGEQPNLLALSRFRLAALRDVEFSSTHDQAGFLQVAFDVLSGHIPPRDEQPMPRYEALWTIRAQEQEEARARAVAAEALHFARSALTQNTLFAPLRDRTREVFGDGGIPLHPGESNSITKQLIYVMEDGLELEQGFSVADSKWFERLCWLIAHDPGVIKNREHLLNLLYTAIIDDAIMLGFSMVGQDTHADFGDLDEQRSYTAQMIAALEGRRPLSLEHVYVPLVMAGAMLTARMSQPSENPWTSLDTLKEARDGRISLAGEGFREVFAILNTLIQRTETQLRELHIPRD